VGSVLRRRNKERIAHRALERALELRVRAARSKPSELVCNALGHLASLYKSIGGYSTAISILREALLIQEELYEPDNIRLAETLNSLGLLYDARIRRGWIKVDPLLPLKATEPLDDATKIIAGFDERYPTPPKVLEPLLEDELELMFEHEDAERAESCFNQAVAIYSHRTTHSHSHSDFVALTVGLRNLSTFLLHRKRGAEALQFLQHLETLQEQEYASNGDRAKTCVSLSKVHARTHSSFARSIDLILILHARLCRPTCSKAILLQHENSYTVLINSLVLSLETTRSQCSRLPPSCVLSINILLN